MDMEMRCLIKNKTWKLIDGPKDRKVLDVKWIYATKVDNLYSPVARMQTLKKYCWLIVVGLTILQMDMEAAFLNDKIKSEIYVPQPRDYEGK